MNEIAKVKKEVKLKQWAEMVQLRNESGLTVSKWCDQNGVNVKTYYYRLKQVTFISHRYCVNVFSVFSMSSVESKNASTITGSKALPDSSRIMP